MTYAGTAAGQCSPSPGLEPAQFIRTQKDWKNCPISAKQSSHGGRYRYFDMYFSNNIPQATPCGTSAAVSVSFISELTCNIYIFCDKKSSKNQSPNIYKNLGIGSHRTKVFWYFKHIEMYQVSSFIKILGIGSPCQGHFHFFSISMITDYFLVFWIFLFKTDRGYHIRSFVTSFVKIKHIYWQFFHNFQ